MQYALTEGYAQQTALVPASPPTETHTPAVMAMGGQERGEIVASSIRDQPLQRALDRCNAVATAFVTRLARPVSVRRGGKEGTARCASAPKG